MYTLMRHVAVGLDTIADVAELRGHEVILSECDPDGWAAGSTRDNPNLFYRNTEYYASYVACAACKLLDMASELGPRVDGMLTWAFQFEDRECFAGLRTLSTNGIDKPVLNVFRLLARLGGTRLGLVSDRSRDPLLHEGGDTIHTLPDVSGIATMNESKEIQVFLSSHHDDWDVHRSTQTRVRLSGLEPGRTYAVYRQMIDDVSANAHTAWVQMGKPQPPDEGEQIKLQEAARLKPEQTADVISVDGQGELSILLSTHSICLLEFVPTGS
jgi:xylan 1,4-beta-xylosidase